MGETLKYDIWRESFKHLTIKYTKYYESYLSFNHSLIDMYLYVFLSLISTD
jgi:hypothetical protein